jgi:hypothetical protein
MGAQKRIRSMGDIPGKCQRKKRSYGEERNLVFNEPFHFR